jgi:hypothetical protein
MPNAKFLEEFALYRKFACPLPGYLSKFEKPRINMNCTECDGTRTFAMINQYYSEYGYENVPSEGLIINPRYRCVSCGKFERHFSIKVSDDLDWIMKVGQFPSWEIAGDQNIEAMLGAHKSLLKKGLISESQGYGIGAFGYYRRIVEEIIDKLLTDVEGLLGDDDKKTYLVALANAKSTRITSEKIELVRDLMPPVLRPDGMNPLSLLHGVLSEGLGIITLT